MAVGASAAKNKKGVEISQILLLILGLIVVIVIITLVIMLKDRIELNYLTDAVQSAKDLAQT